MKRTDRGKMATKQSISKSDKKDDEEPVVTTIKTSYILPLLDKKHDLDDIVMRQKKINKEEQKRLKGHKSDFSVFAEELNLQEFKFEDEAEEELREKKNKEGDMVAAMQMDVGALDKYNEEVRRYRKILIEECRNLPSIVEEGNETLVKVQDAVVKMCRTTYYGTVKAQKLAEGAVPLIVWLINRRLYPENFRIIVLKAMSEMCWSSMGLKLRFLKHNGHKVLLQGLKDFDRSKRLACWCAYTFSMVTIGCPDIVEAARDLKRMEEMVAEISFEYYWHNWPVNFGMVLQGILYGPHSVTPNEDFFQMQ